jgi:hypothetical protein
VQKFWRCLKNNQRENKKIIVNEYAPGQKVLLKANFEGKYAGNLFDGIYIICHITCKYEWYDTIK